MQVKMITAIAGPEFSARPGDVVDVDEGMADELIAGSYAVPTSATIETAILREFENAALIVGNKGKGKK